MKIPRIIGSSTKAIAVLGASACLFAGRGQGADQSAGTGPQFSGRAGEAQEMTLDECLNIAMQKNHGRRASKFAVAMAEAQHRQALAGYWPQLNGKASFEQMDRSPDFLFPASTMSVAAQSIHVPAGTAVVTVPAGILGPTAVQLPVSTPAQTIGVAAQRLPVPAQDVKLMDPDSFVTSLDLTWLLYDGGMRKGYREQTEGFVEMMKADARRTDLEVADSVKRLYYGGVLARELHQVGTDTLARMEATLNLTERMYKEGSGKVKKTDFLDNKVMVETLRAMVAQLEKNEELAQAALANTMGLSWNTSIKPADKELPYTPCAENLDKLVSTAYQFSPDWAKVEAGIRAAEGATRTERSGYYPKLAVTGELHEWWNNYDAGIATDANKQGWTVGVGLQIPIFNGFLTKNKIAEARARVDQTREEQFLLKEGLGLEIKDLFLSLEAAQKSYQATLDAMTAAQENRDLNTRAYQDELVETEKVIRAQLVEALMCAQHYKTRYDHLALQSQLTLVVGTEVLKKLNMNQ
jgi:outer membrane protein TolC